MVSNPDAPMTRLPYFVALFLSVAVARADDRPMPESATHFEDSIRPVLVKTCGECHDPDDPENVVGFLQAKTVEQLAGDRGTWANVAEQLRNRTMPPADAEQPTEANRLRLANWIEETLRATACDGGEYVGWVTTRRLNRAEYDNTIRDLLGVEMHASEFFPVDGSGGEGFDNNGETLFLPPLLMERYLEAATDALDRVVLVPPVERSFGPADLFPPSREPVRDRDRTVGAKQTVTATLTVYVAGEYDVTITAHSPGNGAKASLRVDGIPTKPFDVENETADGKPRSFTVRLARGTHAIGVRNVGPQPFDVARIAIHSRSERPDDAARARHERLFGRPPGTQFEDPATAARDIVARFTRRAFRRPVTDAEVQRFMTLYDRAAERGDPFEEAVKLALKAVLISPHFLFRVEGEPTGDDAVSVSEHELATRLSYFLWSSMPDERLSTLADEGRLSQADVLAGEVERLLADPRAEAFRDGFIGQWLGTREVGARVTPSTERFQREFTTELLLDFRDEPVRFFDHLLTENGSLLDLLDADYAIVNDRLAKHYGLKQGPKDAPGNSWSKNPQRGTGGPFRKMAWKDDRRGGVLGMGGVHLLTSYPDRTSPVLRGGWVLETLLGTKVPSPPPDVPALRRGRGAKGTVREQLAVHRRHAACAACHDLMDPVGFALDNFDVLGRWRKEQGGKAIDASAKLPSGETFDGPAELRKVLLARRDRFTRHLVSRMLGYALGRSLEDGDDCTIDRIAATVERDEYRARTLVREIVLSKPFRFKRRPDDS